MEQNVGHSTARSNAAGVNFFTFEERSICEVVRSSTNAISELKTV